MELETTKDKMKSGYDTLLLGYAAGILDSAQQIAVDAHLTFSNDAKKFIHSCETIGGALISDHCTPEQMSADSLDNILDRLDEQLHDTQTRTQKTFAHNNIEFDLPSPISNILSVQQTPFKWRNLYPGFKSYDFDTGCSSSTARFMKAKPGVKSPHHTHAGTEITLVVDGAFSDETGDYKVGDLIVTDETCEHAPIACKFHGCTCFVVSTAPIKLTGIASILNPFIKP